MGRRKERRKLEERKEKRKNEVPRLYAWVVHDLLRRDFEISEGKDVQRYGHSTNYNY